MALDVFRRGLQLLGFSHPGERKRGEARGSRITRDQGESEAGIASLRTFRTQRHLGSPLPGLHHEVRLDDDAQAYDAYARKTSANDVPADTPPPDIPAHAAPVAPPAPVVPAASVTSAAPPTPSVAFLAPPPADMNIPSPPHGWVAGSGDDYRGTQPKTSELLALTGAIQDLKRFSTRFQATLGTGAPPFEHVLQVFTAGSQWSSSRVATENWDDFASAQEGLAWVGIRVVLETLRPAYDLATKGNATLVTEFPSLTSFLAVQQVIARKGASTRKANKQEKAAGKPETHGRVGKARQTAAAKAALKAANEAAAKAAATPPDDGTSNGQGAPQAAPPVDPAPTPKP